MTLGILATVFGTFSVLGFGCGSPLSGNFNGTIAFTQMGTQPITTNLTGTCQNGTSCTFTGQSASAIHQLTINTSPCNGGVAQITGGTFTQQPLSGVYQQPTTGTAQQPAMPAQPCQSQLQTGGTVTCNSNLSIQIPLFQTMGTSGQMTSSSSCQGQLQVTANRI